MNITKTLNEIIEEMKSDATSENGFGEDFNVSDVSDFARITYPVAVQVKYVMDYIQSRIDNTELRKAEDPYFSGGTANFLFYKKMPAYSICYNMQATNPVIGAIAEVGELQIKKENSDIIYINTKKIKVDKIPYIYESRATTVGEIGDADANEVNIIQHTPVNWGSNFANNFEFSGGQNIEKVEDMRKRFFNQEIQSAYWNEDGIHSDISKIPGVRSVNVIQNREDVEIDGIPRRAVSIIVDGGNDTEIIESIYLKLISATYTLGAIRQDLITLANQTVNIGFDRPNIIDTEFKIEVIFETIPRDIPQSFFDAVIEYGEKIKINGYATSCGAVDYIKENTDEYVNFKSIFVSFKKLGDSEYTHTIGYGSNEKPRMIKG